MQVVFVVKIFFVPPNAQIDLLCEHASKHRRVSSPSVYLLGFGSGLGLGTEVGRGGTTVEVSAKKRLEERVEDDLGTATKS